MSPYDVIVNLKIAYMEGDWEAVSALLASLEGDYGYVDPKEHAALTAGDSDDGSEECAHHVCPTCGTVVLYDDGTPLGYGSYPFIWRADAAIS